MARRLRKKRIAIILLTFTAIVGWTTHSCVSRCTSASDKNKAADSLPKVHINDSISNALTEGKEYQKMDSLVERYLKRWEINGAQLVITRNDSLLYARGFGMADGKAQRHHLGDGCRVQLFVHILLCQHKAGVCIDDAVSAGGTKGRASRRCPRHEHADHKQHNAQRRCQFFHLVFLH